MENLKQNDCVKITDKTSLLLNHKAIVNKVWKNTYEGFCLVSITIPSLGIKTMMKSIDIEKI